MHNIFKTEVATSRPPVDYQASSAFLISEKETVIVLREEILVLKRVERG